MHGLIIDLKGTKVGRWKVLRYVGKSKWRCKCKCGTIRDVEGSTLRGRKTKSCGCLKIEKTIARSTTHGLRRTKEYQIWYKMIYRCTNPKSESWEQYGNRGISVCQGILTSPLVLIELIGKRPPDKTSIDRVNNNGNYSCGKCKQCLRHKWPMNIRWATASEQARNTRRNRWITIGKETKLLCDWLEHFKIREDTFRHRIKIGMSEQEALSSPVRKWKRRK